MPEVPRCYFCGNVCTPEDQDESDYCYGCGHYVCPMCNVNFLLPRMHDVDDHEIDPEDNTV